MRHLTAQNARPRPRPIFAIALAALCLGALRPSPAAGQCTLAGSISKFEPNPPGVLRPPSLNSFLSISGFFPYQPLGSGPRLLVTELFGYQVVDITNRGAPRALGFEDYRIDPTYPGPIPCSGDCHGSISSMAVSADGGRAIFSLSDLAAGASPLGLQTVVGQPSGNGWGFALGGDMAPRVPSSVLVQQVGSGYVAYTFASDGVRVADVSTMPGLSANSIPWRLAPSLPGDGYQATLSGYWITYTNGSTIYLVNASSPLPATGLTAQRFTKADFGRSSDSLMSFSAAQDPANPAAVYLLGEFASGSQHAGYTLIRVQGGTPTVVGSLRPGTGETATYVNSLGADNAGNLFAFMWVRTPPTTPAVAYRQYTSPALAFGAAPVFFDVTTPGFTPGLPALVPGTGAGQIYEYVPSGSSGWVVPMNCVSRNAPAVASMTVANQAGAPLNSGDTVFLGDQITITPSVNPSTAGQPLTGFGWNFDFDFHSSVASEDNGVGVSPRLHAPDNAAFGSPSAPPALINVVGPCDYQAVGDPSSGNLCWNSVTTNVASGGPDFTVPFSAKALTFAFEANNALGSGGASLFTLKWKVPAAKLQSTQILSAQPLESGSDGHPTATGFKWYFGATPTTLAQAPGCAGPTCVPTLDTRGTYSYWLTASYANGYVTPDYAGTAAMGTYTVTDFAPAFTVNGSAAGPASALVNQNLTVTNSSRRGSNITGAYLYNLCQIQTGQTCPAGPYTVFNGMNDPPLVISSSATSATIQVPGVKGSYLLRIQVNYTGGMTTYWPDPSGVAGFPVSVVDVVPTIRVFTNGIDPCRSTPGAGGGGGCSTTFVAYVGDSLTAYSYNGSAQDTTQGITWDFGGGLPLGTGQGAPFKYSSADTYTVTLHGYSLDVTATVVVTQHVSNPLSVSSVTASPSSVSLNTSVSFACSATGGTGSYSYSWSFSDGGTATGSSTSRSFASPGTYSGTCTVSDGQTSASKTAMVTVSSGGVGSQQIWFINSCGFGCSDKNSITVNTGISITAWAYVNGVPDTTTPNLSWNAPGASPQNGSGRTFSLSYGNPGTYTLTLNGYGSGVTATVSVLGPPTGGSACPTFDFDIQHPAGTSVRERSTPGAGGGGSAGGFSASAGWTLWFTQNLGNPPSRWTWDFGDSTAQETTQAPQHVYTKAGVYTVTLTIPSADGSSQCPKSNTITVTEPSGTAGSCVEDPLTICLIGGRYKVTSHWKNQYAGGAPSDLNKTRLTDAIGAFWLSDSSSFEYLIRIDTATDNGHAWISIPMLTDVEFWVDVTDTAVNGQVKEYHSAPGNKIPIYDPLFFVYP